MRGLTAKGVPPHPRWLLYIKITILVLSLIVLALAAYSLSLFGQYAGVIGGTGAGGYLIFVVCAPQAHNPHLPLTPRTFPNRSPSLDNQDLYRHRRRHRSRDLGSPHVLPHRRPCLLHTQHHLLAQRVGVGGFHGVCLALDILLLRILF